MMPHRLAALLLLAALALCTSALAQQAAPVGEVIVKFRVDAGTLRAHAMAARSDASAAALVLARRAGALGQRVGMALEAGAAAGERVQVVRAAGMDAATLAARLAADPEVEYAVPNRRARYAAAPNDPLYLPISGAAPSGPDSGQWYLRAPTDTLKSAIDVETAWTQTRGSTKVVVAVLDSGIRFDHPDLVPVALGGNVLPGYDFVVNLTTAGDGDGRDADASDPGSACGSGTSTWHGTATASLIAAATDNGVGMAGTAPGVRLLPLRVLGKCGGFTSDILAAMRWAVGIRVPGIVPEVNPNPARVINMSLGSECTADAPCTCSPDYRDAVAEVTREGALVVVAAGNDDGGPVGEPGNCAGVATVAAIRHLGTKVGFSNVGPEVGLSAPGGNCVNDFTIGEPCLFPVLAATNTGTTGPLASAWFDSFRFEVGTSFSAPLVAGVAALMMSKQPALTPAETLALLKATARAFPTTGAGDGANGQPVPQCHAPSVGVPQVQCYCTTTTCGAGMLDAGQALAAAAGSPLARISVTTATPTAGAPVTLSAAGSVPAPGTQIVYAWTVQSGGGIVSGLSSTDNAATVTVTPSGAGSFTMQLTIADNAGGTATATQTVTVAAAPSSSGSGGGATSPAWLAGLLLAAGALARRR
ncbi:PKD domain-containing protein [Rubrivivax sp. A210]|uniref:S8 family serine peptidase n=1 Tax=Rubrivivax sp. A210 TaxID=2772301 RepID=UPI00191AE1A9|nr:S8 family serine peptidase [Rubrivivax sp. A210]CAD5371814.1 PKD domain-containing protein [Rubrivivax sp. A210]